MPPCFNPRPTRRQGATRRTSRGYLHPAPFQSSPPPKAGRNVALVMVVTASRRFNPRPTRRQGATQGPAERGLRLPGVSILAPPEGRAQRHASRPAYPTCQCFNPRPTRRQGATLAGATRSRVTTVSILAPPEGRAQLVHEVPGKAA